MRSGAVTAALVACLGLAACGGQPQTGAGPSVGPVDLTQAPAALALSCAGAPTSLALKMPCLVGLNLGGAGTATTGVHETECSMAESGDNYVWSFLLPLNTLAQHPETVVAFPGTLRGSMPTGMIDLGAEKASITGVSGSLSFSRVDPQARAFEGAFTGRMVLRGATSGTEITCDVDGPFWGAPGGFI